MNTPNNPNALNFCPTLMDLYHKRSAVGRSGKTFNGLAALSTPHNLVTIRNLILKFQPNRTLEIGLAFGGSYLTIASCLRENGLHAQQQHIAIDPYQETVWDDVALCLGEQAGLNGYLDVKRENSSLVLPELVKATTQIDLIYIDGSHLFEDVFIDYYYSFQLLQNNGLLLFDDSQDKHVKKVIRFIRSNMSNYFKEVNLGSYHPLGKSLKYITAQRLDLIQLTAFQKICSDNREWNAKYFDF